MQQGSTKSQSNLRSWIFGAVLAAACLGFGAGLSGYAASGAYMRYSGDDYCYSAVLAEHGFWQTQIYAYLYETSYGGNRFTLNLAAAISSEVGPMASAVLPGLILVLWIGGMSLFLRELSKAFLGTGQPPVWLLLSGAVAFFVLHNTPNLDQSFYWRSALLTYLLPMTVNTYLAALVLNRIRSSASLRLSIGLILVFSFLSAGFSETVTALQAGIYAIAVAAAWWLNRSQTIRFPNKNWTRRAVWLTGAALLGALLAMVVLALSPANHLRQSALPPPPALLPLVRMSLYNAYIFTRISISKGFWQLLLCGLLFIGLSSLNALSQSPKPLQLSRYLAGLFCCAAIGYILVVCAVTPSVYGESSYPDLRALIACWWVLMVETGALGWLTGQVLGRWLPTNLSVASIDGIKLAACLGVLAICALPVAASINLYTQLPRYQRWARFWDARNAQIWQASRSNQGRVEVMQIDHIIKDVSDLSPNPAFWYNVCAARYYGVKQIVADLPGWDK